MKLTILVEIHSVSQHEVVHWAGIRVISTGRLDFVFICWSFGKITVVPLSKWIQTSELLKTKGSINFFPSTPA